MFFLGSDKEHIQSLKDSISRRKTYRNPELNKRLEWTFIAFIHVLVATGVALVGTGASALAGNDANPNDLTLIKVGMALLEACWATLVLATLIALLPSQHRQDAPAHTEGTRVNRRLRSRAFKQKICIY